MELLPKKYTLNEINDISFTGFEFILNNESGGNQIGSAAQKERRCPLIKQTIQRKNEACSARKSHGHLHTRY